MGNKLTILFSASNGNLIEVFAEAIKAKSFVN